MKTDIICPNCAAVREFKKENRHESYSIRGEEFSFPVQVMVCKTCGEALFDEKRDSAIMDRVYAEFRKRKNLLTPNEIVRIRESYRLSQRAFASLLGMAQPTIARYETGAIQDDVHDRLIRVYSKPQNMKALLHDRGHLLSKQQFNKVRDALDGCGLLEQIDFSSLMHNGPDEYTGFRTFDFEQYVKSVLWFCWKFDAVASTKLNKLLFYADYVHFKIHSVSITGTAYRKLQYGPVPEHYGTLRDLMEMEGYVSLRETPHHDYVSVEYIPGPRALEVDGDFSAAEVCIFEAIAEHLGSCTARQISDKSHQEKAWIETPDRALISYMFAEFLKTLD